MQQLHGNMQLQTSSPTKQDPSGDMHPIRRARATYRVRGIHESFDRISLERELCAYFDIEKDGFIIHSLAYDAPYGRSSRQKVATATFKTTPERLRAGTRWQAEIPFPRGEPQELCTIYFDTAFEGFTPLTAAEQEDDTHTE